jgi:hypothetical protein
MNAPMVARILGVLFLLAGIGGFLPWIAPDAPFDARVVTWNAFYRMLFGIFPVNLGHDIVHLFFGLLGVWAGSNFKAAVLYCRVVVWTYLLLVIFGIIPMLNTVMGIAPVYGWDILLHFMTMLLALYGGYGRGSMVTQVPASPA